MRSPKVNAEVCALTPLEAPESAQDQSRASSRPTIPPKVTQTRFCPSCGVPLIIAYRKYCGIDCQVADRLSVDHQITQAHQVYGLGYGINMRNTRHGAV